MNRPAIHIRLRDAPISERVRAVARDTSAVLRLGMRCTGEIPQRASEPEMFVKEHLGPLEDLHALEERRLRKFVAGIPVLSAANPTNRVTEASGHNRTPVILLLERLRMLRVVPVRKLELLTEEPAIRTALHPRLQRSLRLLDWAYFIAEHDDHHLAQARRVLVASVQRLSLQAEGI